MFRFRVLFRYIHKPDLNQTYSLVFLFNFLCFSSGFFFVFWLCFTSVSLLVLLNLSSWLINFTEAVFYIALFQYGDTCFGMGTLPKTVTPSLWATNYDTTETKYSVHLYTVLLQKTCSFYKSWGYGVVLLHKKYQPLE